MKLTDLNPEFVGHGGDSLADDKDGNPIPRREAVALSFDCPCGGKCGQRPCLFFENPQDGGPPLPGTTWTRTGDTFETLTLIPSIQRKGGCNWHGFITNGDVDKNRPPGWKP